MRKVIKDCFVIAFLAMTLVGEKPAMAIYDPLSVPNNKFGIHILEPAEVEKASQFANSTGGEWGYVTIPIRANDRDLEKWTRFMEDCKDFKIIPLLRIASFPVDSHWMAPNEYDLLAFVNFLDQLPWPVKNRYVLIYNEPNHAGEWGGFVYPEEYARILDRAVDLFRQVNNNFFIISAGLDFSQNNVYQYIRTMKQTVPDIFEKVDGLAFHVYGNNLVSYRTEQGYMGVSKPIFLTEVGDKNPTDWYFLSALNYFWTDKNIVAITPFVLNGGDGLFIDFNFVNLQGNFKSFARKIMEMPKTAGKPLIAEESRILNLESRTQVDSGRGQNDEKVEINILDRIFELLRRFFG